MDPFVFVFDTPAFAYPERFRQLFLRNFLLPPFYKKETYPYLIKLPYLSVFKNENCEIYEYQHYTSLNKGNKDFSPFLIEDETRELIVETATVFSFYDKFLVSKGHSLIVSKRLVSNYFDLTLKEQTACWIVSNKVKTILQEKYNPDGFNVGININEACGQTISHCHIHIIHRYQGDVANPRGGIRGVIPSKKEY